MIDFGPAALVGLCVGFMFGVGCAMAVLYSIYLGGYRKAVEDSLQPQKTRRWRDALKKLEDRAAKAAPEK